ncbi:type II toxin-antitoxin system YafQ family toxin [Colwellia sp. C1TZA3]|uniref:type II toxin-antitoxin system YafQ family toxin n=1 Tax=Colwellia sp. C1TZA3 TaxID=2508879 RepID=UPI0011B9EFB5|nr:type II toxin-antitoxin system YafQ family toxin [Colwellia sp. C1TZA3]TWX68297.1 type II toxin-antitoxin system YafQ family toxin [Colwellia sp. C1TZA3]
MLTLDYSSQFKKDFKKDFKKVTKLSIPEIIDVGNVISTLQKGLLLDARYVDHSLIGNWHGFRDCHIKPDLLLIYRIHETYLQLARVGTQNDLF